VEEKIEQSAEDVKTEAKDTKKKKNSELEELKEKISELEGKLKEADDKYLRMAAEYDNFRRRSREEREGVYEAAVADTVAELLPIIDNLERAAMYDGEKVKEGLVMIEKSVGEVFSKLGIEAVGALGDKFDPNLHNAVMHSEDESLGEGEITDVFQKGYKKGKRVIRFAMVKSVN
jgi:molecular chaperone GrpE